MSNFWDHFFNAFNESRCKTAMLMISVIIAFGYVMTILLQVPSNNLGEIVMMILAFWIGRTTKAKDKNDRQIN